MQKSGNEEPNNLFPAFREIYKSNHGLATQGNSKKRKHFNMYDEEMGYALTQHSLWTSNHTLFLLYKCKREDAVRKADHVCKLITHKDYAELKDKSSRKLHRKTREIQVKGKEYDLDARHAWIDSIIVVFRILEYIPTIYG